MTNNMHVVHFSNVKWLVILSYFLGLVLDSMSSLSILPGHFPSFTLLLIFYWTIQIQNITHLFSAFILGLLSDAIFNTTLGAHAILFSFLVFILLRTRLQFKSYPLWQQTLILTVYLYLFQLIGLLFFQPNLEGNSLSIYWAIPTLTLILWPLGNRLLNTFTYKTSYN